MGTNDNARNSRTPEKISRMKKKLEKIVERNKDKEENLRKQCVSFYEAKDDLHERLMKFIKFLKDDRLMS